MKKLLFLSSIVLLALAMKKSEKNQPLTFEQATEAILEKWVEYDKALGTSGDTILAFNDLKTSIDYFFTTYPDWQSDWNSSARPTGWQQACENICLFGVAACWQNAGSVRERSYCLIHYRECLVLCGRLPEYWQ